MQNRETDREYNNLKLILSSHQQKAEGEKPVALEAENLQTLKDEFTVQLNFPIIWWNLK